MNYQKLRLNQVDRNLAQAKALFFNVPQYDCWIKTVREALGMSTRQLAKRLNASQSVVTSAERNELAHTITLAQLDKLADALGCKVVYSFIPESSLEAMVNERAEAIAKAQVSMVQHTMRLEDQSVGHGFSEQQINIIKQKLLEGKWSKLWD
jgi:predicted DNA-binding mobile mystery protein A